MPELGSASPLNRLFQLGRPGPRWPDKGLDYVAAMGIGSEHVPALIELALAWPEAVVKSESVAGWAAPHAWRALAQLGAVDAVGPLLGMMNRLAVLHDDWYLNEFPQVFAMIGPMAIPELAAYMTDTSNKNFARGAAASGLKHIGQKHPDALPQVMTHLNSQLARFEENDEEFNSLLLCDLLDLKAVESVDMIARAYAAGKVDEGMVAWEDVQRDLGISADRPAPNHPPPDPEQFTSTTQSEQCETQPAQYHAPLDRLFQMGEVEWGVEWQGDDPDYVRDLGLTSEHVPALIEIALLQANLEDFPDDDSGWAPVHAWRALAQLRAAEAVEPLLTLQNRLDGSGDEYHMYDFPVVFGMIGPPVIPALAAYLHNPENPLYPRTTAGEGLCNIGLRYPEARGEALAPLAEQIARFAENDYELNGFLVGQLTRLKATEVAETIERAFASNRVAEDIAGYWGTVRQELGVAGMGLAPDEPPRPPRSSSKGFGLRMGPQDRGPLDRKKEKAAKVKRKQQEKAKKRNRKRK